MKRKRLPHFRLCLFCQDRKTSVPLTLDKDFTFIAADNSSLSGASTMQPAKISSPWTTMQSSMNNLSSSRQFYTDAAVTYFMEEISGKSKALGFLLTARDNEPPAQPDRRPRHRLSLPRCPENSPTSCARTPQQSSPSQQPSSRLGRTGYNIAGMYPGTDRFIGMRRLSWEWATTTWTAKEKRFSPSISN